MSAPVDVLAVLDDHMLVHGRNRCANHQVELFEVRAAVAELIEAAETFDALIVEREQFLGCLSPEMRVVRDKNRAALARVKGGAA
jgi:hypothetical protein